MSPPHQVIVFVVNHGCGCLVWVRIGFAEPKNVIEVKTNAPGKPDACQCFFSVISSWKVLSSGHNLTIFSISSCMKSVWLASTSAILNMNPLSLVTKDWQNVLQCRVPPWKHSLSICTGLQVNDNPVAWSKDIILDCSKVSGHSMQFIALTSFDASWPPVRTSRLF